MTLLLSKIMNGMMAVKAATPFADNNDPTAGAKDPNSYAWVWDIVDVFKAILWPILVVVSAAGMIYGIVLGVNMARADSTEKRDEAKKRLINVIIGLAVAVGLILFFQLVMYVILPNFLDYTAPQS